MKKRIIATVAGLAMATTAHAASLADLQWKNRVFVIFAPTDNSEFQKQKEILKAEEAGLSERQMVVIHVDGDEAETLAGADNYSAGDVRAALEGPADEMFEAVLVGKDGGVKLRETKAVTAGELFTLIDSMPMRANEAKP